MTSDFSLVSATDGMKMRLEFQRIRMHCVRNKRLRTHMSSASSSTDGNSSFGVMFESSIRLFAHAVDGWLSDGAACRTEFSQ